jgi:thioredoxin reductase (NADPH)
MSDYLVRELERTPNIDLHFNAEVVDGLGGSRLEALTVRDVTSGTEQTLATSALFVLIGAEPTTDWLPPSVARDRWGYVLTGADVTPPRDTPTLDGARPFETSFPGVFAVGDVRHGSIKRVASAVGEGSACIRVVHERLAVSGSRR